MSMFTDRLRNDRNPFDNYDLREQAADKIEKLEERVEALSAALREIAEDCYNDGGKAATEMTQVARAALAPEQDK